MSSSSTQPHSTSTALAFLSPPPPRKVIITGHCFPRDQPTSGKRQGYRVTVFEEEGVIHKVVYPGQGKIPPVSELPPNPLDPSLYLPVYCDAWLRYNDVTTFSSKELIQKDTSAHSKYPRYYSQRDSSWIADEFLRDIHMNEHIRVQQQNHKELDFSNLCIYLGCCVNEDNLVWSLQFERLERTLWEDVRKGTSVDWDRVRKDITKAINQLASIGVVYTDMRSDNIMRDGEGHWKLIDFADCIIEKREGEVVSSLENSDKVKIALKKLGEIVKDECKSEF